MCSTKRSVLSLLSLSLLAVIKTIFEKEYKLSAVDLQPSTDKTLNVKNVNVLSVKGCRSTAKSLYSLQKTFLARERFLLYFNLIRLIFFYCMTEE